MAETSAKEVIDYWYSDKIKASWFNSTPQIDVEIKTKYEFLWESALKGLVDNWQQTAEGCLALCIIFDQLPLNMYRGKAKSFQTERKAIKITKYAIEQGFLTNIKAEQLAFIIMPLMHSENLDDQNLSVELFKQYNLTENISFAEHHQNIIKTYGRFPHRNQILERKTTKKEQKYLNSEKAFTG